jgi:two-component system OmpR family sensor kinase
MRSFRFELASRYAATMAAGITLLAGLGYFALRDALDRQINASLLNVASIQAASVTDDPSGEMQFHEWALTPEEAFSLKDLTRYAQIWNETGASLVRSQYLTRDLPLDTAALRTSAEGEFAWAEAPFGDGSIRSIYYPLGRMGPSHSRHIIQVAAPLTARNDTLRSALLFLAGLVLLVSAGSMLGSWWLAGRAVQAVHDITEQAEGIGATTLGERISAHADTHEFRRLVQVLNIMLDRIDAAFETQKRFTADASHELRSPLTALRGELELARRRDRSPEEYRRVLDSALEETERISQLAEDLLTLARSDAGVMRPRLQEVDLGTRVRETVNRLETRAKDRSQRVRVNAVGDTTALLDPDLIDRLIWNLVDNAIKFTSPGGSIEIEVSSSDGECVLEVADTGPGIRKEELPTIFDRFAQADASHASVEGTGLGLAIARAITTAHGGRVSAHNRSTGGALFRVRLPRAGETVETQ